MKKNDSWRYCRTRSVNRRSVEVGAVYDSTTSSRSGLKENEKLHNKQKSVNRRSVEVGAVSNSNSTTSWRSRSEFCGDERNEKLQNKQKSDRFKRNQQISFKWIESLLEKPLEEVVQSLIENEHFFNFIATKLSPDYVVLIVKLLGRFCDCVFANLRIEIFQKSLSSGFLGNLQAYVSSIAVQTAKDKKFNSFYWTDPDSFWSNYIKFNSVLLKEIPNFFVDNLLKLVKIAKLNIPHIELEHQVHICDKTKNDLKDMISRAEKIVTARTCQNPPSQNREIIDNSEEEPPEDFHEVSIFPTSDELINKNKPFVRRNIVKGSYKDVDHYLDIQFRLLREDFVGPLRLAIQGHLTGKKQSDIQDIKIHQKVQFLNPVTLTEDYCVLLKFHFGGKLNKFKFEDSRKFMYGSLVCFTKDNFNSLIFGRIVDRKDENLRNGQLVIGFNRAEAIDLNTDYIMVECSIYFEPYYHVLNVLKRIGEEDFPMKNYIVYIDESVLSPNYGNPLIPYKIQSYQKVNTYFIFNPTISPNFDDLNESQNQAFMAALRRQLTIIQGPPGTGKTYVGLKVAKTLLNNSNVWCHSPMLIICYTNHALDQFLEGLIGTTDKIVRIGGQSKNENLKRFNIREHDRKMNPAVWKARDRVTYSLNSIKEVSDVLSAITRYNSIICIKYFAGVIPNFHNSWLADASDSDFLEWLLEDDFPEDKHHTLGETTADDLSLVQKFENFDIEEEVDEEDEPNESNILDEFLTTRVSGIEESLLDLCWLETEIKYITDRMIKLESQFTDNNEHLFAHMTLGIRKEKLKATYDFVKVKLASHDIAELPFDTDARNSKYIPLHERWNLYFYWLNLLKENLLVNYEKLNSEYRRACEIYNQLKEMGNIEILREMKVIGMTTTSAARLHSSLQLLKNPIVIVEEAAEVLEAHIVAALTKHCQQLILIGDHQQLRPNTANYEMEKNYKLGISLFERMIMNEVQCFTLNIQHRMRPEISSLIKPTIYPNLIDHESVLDRPMITGVEKCLYFIDHKNPEENKTNSSTSKKNIHEAKFLIQLARYLILNGYHPHQITILAAYLGQMFEIQKLKKQTDLLKEVRISVLDNYQGEESDIILLSLVRNNENTIGFLSIENRVCVALSRARNGLYVMGNMSLLCDKSKLWVKIRETFLAQEAVGSALSLKCQNHGKITMVSTAEDFRSVPEGGCNQICNDSLVCGHKCKMLCHVLDKEHEKYICMEACKKLLCDSDLRHICRKMCGEDCGLCEYPKHERLDCGHEAVMPCHMNPEDYQCLTQVKVTLPCDHDAIKPCYIETKQYKCGVPCEARLDCGHSCLLRCHTSNDPDHLKYKCPKPCTKFRLGCMNLKDDTHKCSRSCHELCEPCKKLVRKSRTVCPHYYDVPCNQNVDEIECSKPCKRQLNCGHMCPNICQDECLTTCTKKVKKTVPGCNHVVELPCNVEANKIHCNKKCPRLMECGHICGEICKMVCDPSKCKQMVKVAILAKCGHIVKEVPCFINTLYKMKGESSVEDLISYCTEPCTAILNCGPEVKHLCSGSCGSCYQGRIHKRCSKTCSRILICNHECKGFCRDACKPCMKKCSYKCKHSVCKKRCGDLCIKCKEPCNRKCKHRRCSKLCGEICDVPPCEEACERSLACGHPCIGFCSEPCPPLCRICNKNDVEELFFGTEDEEDARFILLNDCGHIFENSGMKQWMEQSSEKIGFKECPKCKTNIFVTERYSDYIKRSVEAISKAKIKEIGTELDILTKRSELRLKVGNLSFPIRSHFNVHKSLVKNQNILLDRLLKVDKKERRQNFNLVELNAIEIKYQLMEQIFNIMKTSDLNDLSSLTSFESPVENQVNLILDNLLREVDDITTTEIEDIQREIIRLHRMIQVLPLLKTKKYQENNMSIRIDKVNKQINQLSKYDEAVDDTVKQELKDLRKKLGLLGITELEKQDVVKAMGLTKGHWYMCPNGHPYVITECGGAMQIGKCPACKALIGGENHRLLGTNRVATFMDGATHSAWSEYQNMNNYEY